MRGPGRYMIKPLHKSVVNRICSEMNDKATSGEKRVNVRDLLRLVSGEESHDEFEMTSRRKESLWGLAQYFSSVALWGQSFMCVSFISRRYGRVLKHRQSLTSFIHASHYIAICLSEYQSHCRNFALPQANTRIAIVEMVQPSSGRPGNR